MHDSIISELSSCMNGNIVRRNLRISSKGLHLKARQSYPFCGAGTTAIAALRLKRKFIGIDKDTRAIEAAIANLTLSLQSQIKERETRAVQTSQI